MVYGLFTFFIFSIWFYTFIEFVRKCTFLKGFDWIVKNIQHMKNTKTQDQTKQQTAVKIANKVFDTKELFHGIVNVFLIQPYTARYSRINIAIYTVTLAINIAISAVTLYSHIYSLYSQMEPDRAR